MKCHKILLSTGAGLLALAGINGLIASPSLALSTKDEAAKDEAAQVQPLSEPAIAGKLSVARVPFVENRGQLAQDDVSFYARMFAGSLFITERNELVYALPQQRIEGDHPQASPVWAFQESFSNARQTRPQGAHASAVQVSEFRGDQPSRWKQGLATWDSLDLGEVYPGIRVRLKATGNNVEKLFHVAPGVNAELIDIAVEGVDGVSTNRDSQLVLETELGDIVFTAPVAYQRIDGERRPVEVAYALRDGGHYGFSVGDYDHSRELVIDPLLASTYIGGRNPNPPGNYDDDIIHGMVTNGGDVYVAGATQSPDFPVQLGYDETLDSAYPDGFISRLSGDLSTIVASTYFGTEGFDRVADIALDTDGSLVVVGQAGYGFPLTDGAYNWSGETPTGGGFVARFSADLATLIASAVPTPGDYPVRVGLGNGGIYFGGTTNNPDFPITSGAFRDTCCPVGGFGIREYDGFAGRLSADLSSLEAMTYLGGDLVSGISVAPDGNVYITDGTDNAVTGYISRMDAGLTTRSAFLSYYPGSQSGSSRTYFNDVVAADNFVVAAGQTYMYDLPATPGAFDTTCGSDGLCDGVGSLLVPKPDGFIAIYSKDLQQTFALTYFGGSERESIRALALAGNGDILVTGETTSVDFPVSGNAADSACGTDGQCDPSGRFNSPVPDGFIARLAGDLSLLQYGSYLGGSSEDRPQALVEDAAGHVYTAGYTRSPDFPTTAGAFDSTWNGGTSDAFISQFDTAGTGGNQLPQADAGDDQAVASRQIVILNGRDSSDPDGEISGYRWSQVFGRQVKLFNADAAVALFRAPGVRSGVTRVLVFELEVTDDQGATATDRVRVYIRG